MTSEFERLLDAESPAPGVELLRAVSAQSPPDPAARHAALTALLLASSQGSASMLGRNALLWGGGLLSCLGAVAFFALHAPPLARAPQRSLGARSAASPAPQDAHAVAPALAVSDLPLAPAAPRRSPMRAPLAAADEILFIERAREALGHGDAAAALAQVGDYRAAYPRGKFAEEAELLEIRALAALGRKGEAERHARRFLDTHAESPYVQRVRSAVGMAP